MYFEDLDLSYNILDALYDMHFEECTPIQEQCIPHILEGKDILGIAQTGTGKTAAYLLPILIKYQRYFIICVNLWTTNKSVDKE